VSEFFFIWTDTLSTKLLLTPDTLLHLRFCDLEKVCQRSVSLTSLTLRADTLFLLPPKKSIDVLSRFPTYSRPSRPIPPISPFVKRRIERHPEPVYRPRLQMYLLPYVDRQVPKQVSLHNRHLLHLVLLGSESCLALATLVVDYFFPRP
jgi:hypothetical protein